MKIAHQFVLGSLLRVSSLVLKTGAMLFLIPFIIHSLGDRMYGYWTVVSAVVGYYIILDLGIVSAIQFYVAHSIGEMKLRKANEVISTAFFGFALIGVLMLLITAVLSYFPKLVVQDSSEADLFQKVIMILGIGCAIGFPGRVFIGVISANLRYDLLSYVEIGCLLLRVASTIVVLKAGYGIVGLAAGSVLTDIFFYLPYYMISQKIQKEFKLSIRLASFRVFREIMGYGIYTFFVKTGDQFRYYAFSLIVSGFISLSAVTHYSIASQLATYLINLMIAAMGMLAPYFSLLLGSNDRAGMGKTFLFGTKVCVILSTLVVFSLIFYGRPFLQVWMGADYLDAYAPLVILLVGVFSDVAQLPSGSYLYGVAKHHFLAYMTLVEGIMNVLLSIYLVRKYGLIGVALGCSIPMLIFRFFFQAIYVCRSLNISLHNYYMKILVLPALTGGLVMFLLWDIVFRKLNCENFVDLGFIVAGQAGIAIPFVMVAALDRGERQKILSLARRWNLFGKKLYVGK